MIVGHCKYCLKSGHYDSRTLSITGQDSGHVITGCQNVWSAFSCTPANCCPHPSNILALCWKNAAKIYRNPWLVIFQFIIPTLQVREYSNVKQSTIHVYTFYALLQTCICLICESNDVCSWSIIYRYLYCVSLLVEIFTMSILLISMLIQVVPQVRLQHTLIQAMKQLPTYVQTVLNI